jgi:hypothetical protein
MASCNWEQLLRSCSKAGLVIVLEVSWPSISFATSPCLIQHHGRHDQQMALRASPNITERVVVITQASLGAATQGGFQQLQRRDSRKRELWER